MLTQEQLPMVAMPSMNDTHLEELLLINRILEAVEARDAEAVDALFEALTEHTLEHFSGEEAMMREKRFPPYLMHKSEHDRALNEMRMALTLWRQHRDFERLRYYIETTLVDWVVNHIQTMDTVTANFLAHGVSPCGGGAC